MFLFAHAEGLLKRVGRESAHPTKLSHIKAYFLYVFTPSAVANNSTLAGLAELVGRISLRNPPYEKLSFGAIRFAIDALQKIKKYLCKPISMRLAEALFYVKKCLFLISFHTIGRRQQQYIGWARSK